MDPDVVRARILHLARWIIEQRNLNPTEGLEDPEVQEATEELAESIIDLHEWEAKGGF